MTAATAAPTRLLTGAFAVLMVSSLVFFVGSGITIPVAPRFARGPIGLEGAAFGLAIGMFSLAALAARPVVGWIADRYGRRPLLVGGALITAVGTALHLVVGSLVPFVAVRALLGVGEAAFLVAMLSAAADLAPDGRTGEAISLGSLALWLGVAIGPVIGEWLLGGGSYGPVWIGAAVLALVAAGLSLAVPETRPMTRASGEAPPRGRLFHPAAVLPGFLVLCATWGMGGFLPFLPLHAADLGEGGAGVAFALYGGIICAIRLFGARLPDRFGPARLAAVALAITSAGLLLLGILPGYAGMLVGTAVFAVGIALAIPAILALAIARAPAAERGSVVGTTSVFLDLSFGIAPVVLTPLADVAGYEAAFIASGVVAAAGVLLVALTRPTTPAPAALAE